MASVCQQWLKEKKRVSVGLLKDRNSCQRTICRWDVFVFHFLSQAKNWQRQAMEKSWELTGKVRRCLKGQEWSGPTCPGGNLGLLEEMSYLVSLSAIGLMCKVGRMGQESSYVQEDSKSEPRWATISRESFKRQIFNPCISTSVISKKKKSKSFLSSLDGVFPDIKSMGSKTSTDSYFASSPRVTFVYSW